MGPPAPVKQRGGKRISRKKKPKSVFNAKPSRDVRIATVELRKEAERAMSEIKALRVLLNLLFMRKRSSYIRCTKKFIITL